MAPSPESMESELGFQPEPNEDGTTIGAKIGRGRMNSIYACVEAWRSSKPRFLSSRLKKLRSRDLNQTVPLPKFRILGVRSGREPGDLWQRGRRDQQTVPKSFMPILDSRSIGVMARLRSFRSGDTDLARSEN